MPVRRIVPSQESGYGSFGLTQISPGLITRADMKLEMRNMLAFVPPDRDTTNDPVCVVTTVAFRWKFTVGDVNADIQKVFNAEIGKRKLGTVIVEHQDYVCDEVYTCYGQQMSSRIYTSSFVSLPGALEPLDEIPCDEPPSDEAITLVRNAAYVGSNWLPFYGNPPGAANSMDMCLGDRVTFYPEPCVLRYNFGGSYVYRHHLIYPGPNFGNQTPIVINF